MRTKAVRDGNSSVSNAAKQWISKRLLRASVFAAMDEDMRRARQSIISCFLVPTDNSGFAIDSDIKIFGPPGTTRRPCLSRKNMVPAADVIGQLHRGFDVALGGVSVSFMLAE
jgi:alkylation response protein AidB-like acyl-CoA dehydrogenase